MNVLAFQGLLISPLIFFIMVSLLMTIVTIFLVPKSIGQYVIFNEYWLKLIIFICYMAINMLIFGNVL